MQREAEQRVREMQSRARLLGTEQQTFKSRPPPAFKNKSFDLPAVFENMEGDKMLILALLWILWQEKADSKLLLALLYLLL